MRLIASVLALLLLAACQPAPEAGCARLPSAGQYCLQGSPGPHFETLQESVLSAGGQRHTLLTRLGNDKTGLRFVALSPLGQTVFAVSWENGALHATLPEALAGRIDPAPLYSHRYELDELGEALAATRDKPQGFVKALVMFS